MPVGTTISVIAGAIALLFRVMGVAPALQRQLRRYRGKPSKEDAQQLVQFCTFLDQRRVFYAPYNSEVVEACVGSLSYVKERTEAIIAAITHAGAQAVLGALLDDLRAFLDKWHGFRTPPGWHRDERLAEFYEDLGQLRQRARTWTSTLTEIEPKAKVPKLG